MLHTLFSLIKFNVFCALVTLGFMLYLDFYHINQSKTIPTILALLFVLGWVLMNIKIIVSNRKRIAASVMDKSVDLAASAIEFKEAANARVKQRMEERKTRL